MRNGRSVWLFTVRPLFLFLNDSQRWLAYCRSRLVFTIGG